MQVQMLRKYCAFMFVFLSCLLATSVDTWSRKKAPLAGRVTTSYDGLCYFKMRPDPDVPTSEESGRGEFYKVMADGPDQLMWKTQGWYAYTVYITCDCNTLIRLGTIFPRHSPNELAIAFYWRGKLVRSYSLKELVKWDFHKIWPPNVSKDWRLNYHPYLSKLPYLNRDNGTFNIKTVDGQKIKFSLDVNNFANIIKQ